MKRTMVSRSEIQRRSGLLSGHRIVVTTFAVLCIAPHLTAFEVEAAKRLWCIDLDLTEERKRSNNADWAAKFAEYAILSNAAYAEKGVNPSMPLPKGWSIAGAPVKSSKKPRNDWSPTSWFGDNGFSMSVFEKREQETILEVAVAFRGTDQKRDWVQNTIPKFQAQAADAENAFRAVLAKYRSSGSSAPKITATGHSLGGGLALHVSFLWPNVDAFVFNSSPRIGVKRSDIKSNRVSIFEAGEALDRIRRLNKMVRPEWEGIDSRDFHFYDGSEDGLRGALRALVSQHGIEGFASRLVSFGKVKSPVLQDYVNNTCR